MRASTCLKQVGAVVAAGALVLSLPGTASAVTADVVNETATGAGSRTFALTIDDGPSPIWTPQVLDLLKARGVKATFCLMGDHVLAYPDMVRRIVAEGHHLCNHTMHHVNPTTQDTDGQLADMEAATAAIHQVVPDAPIAYYRAPQGGWTDESRQHALEMGMQPIGWSVETNDWTRPGADAIFDNYKSQFRDGGVILMHDNSEIPDQDRSQSVEAMGRILDDLAANGYTDDVPDIRG